MTRPAQHHGRANVRLGHQLDREELGRGQQVVNNHYRGGPIGQVHGPEAHRDPDRHDVGPEQLELGQRVRDIQRRVAQTEVLIRSGHRGQVHRRLTRGVQQGPHPVPAGRLGGEHRRRPRPRRRHDHSPRLPRSRPSRRPSPPVSDVVDHESPATANVWTTSPHTYRCARQRQKTGLSRPRIDPDLGQPKSENEGRTLLALQVPPQARPGQRGPRGGSNALSSSGSARGTPEHGHQRPGKNLSNLIGFRPLHLGTFSGRRPWISTATSPSPGRQP